MSLSDTHVYASTADAAWPAEHTTSQVLAAVLTPPDVVSQLMLAIPMCLLYELGIHAARWLVPSSAVKKPAA